MNNPLIDLYNKYPQLECCKKDIEAALNMLTICFRGKGLLMTCGNGGSASDSEHIVGELMKGFKSKRPLQDDAKAAFKAHLHEDTDYLINHLQGALPSISLTSNVSLNTAFANDVSADMIFAQQVYGYGKKGDVLIGLSTSGNSKNVLRAMQVAKVIGVGTIGFTGVDGGMMKNLCDVTIRVPEDSTPAIQELHLPVYHALCLMLEQIFFS